MRRRRRTGLPTATEKDANSRRARPFFPRDRYSDTAGTTQIGTTTMAYDSGGRETGITHLDGSGTKIDDFSYSYDAADRVTQETSTLGPTQDYTYDDNGQLTSDGTNTYTFDANGNRTNTGYSTNTGNRLSSDGTYNYTYNDEGDLTEKDNISSGAVTVYTYSNLNQLVKVQHKPSSTGSVDMEEDFKYDVFGNLIERSYDDDGAGPDAAVVTKYAFESLSGDVSGAGSVGNAQWNAWADLDNSGSLTTRRLYERSVDAVFARMDSSGNVAWYLKDHLGSVRDMTDGSGTLKDHIDFDGWGNITSETHSTFGDRYKYTSREWDAEIQLQLNGARWYDPTTSRWISEDPERFNAGDNNLYRYGATRSRRCICDAPSTDGG